MKTTENGKFVVSYSGGKDAALALFRAVKSGMKPIGALTTFDRTNGRSWFHGIPETVLRRTEQALGIPLKILDTESERYEKDFENGLKDFKRLGAESVVFGDIDIREHYDWCDTRCKNVGLKSFFPLWKEDRRKVVEELVHTGFLAVITRIDTTKLDGKYLGKTLTKEIVAQISGRGADACGENGEYHTFVYGGPIFRCKITFEAGPPVKSDKHLHLPLR